MSEHALWKRIRDKIGHVGHFSRLEFNPEDGIPDVDYCIQGEEGKIELKHAHEFPMRSTTRVFGPHGLRDAQVVWIYTRIRHGGRAWILAQVDTTLFLVPGTHCRTFNEMTEHQLGKASVWTAKGAITIEEWQQFIKLLKGRQCFTELKTR
jgi:hypothetical protein